ncbi:hypothetical protein REPUB_Repub20aG0077700 [Reevesia pubescens]
MFDGAFLRGVTSFLFSNFPDGWSPKDLWYMFARFCTGLGRIADVFIPGRKDRKGDNFGFVRFKDVKDVRAMKAKLNTIWIGSFKLRITIAKTRRFVAKGANTQEGGASREDSFNGEVVPNADSSKLNSKNSYKQALMVNVPPATALKKDIFVNVKNEEWEWLRDTVVGVIHEFNTLPSLQDFFWDMGLQVKIFPLGGHLVLLRTDSKARLLDFIREEEDIWKQNFSSLHVWSPSDFPVERFTWIKVDGLPLQLWNSSGFATVGNAIGQFVWVDFDTLLLKRLFSARILVSIPLLANISPSVSVNFNGVSYSLRIQEDHAPSDNWWVEKPSKSDVLIDDDNSISSCESDMGDNCGFWNGDAASEEEQSVALGEEDEPGGQEISDSSIPRRTSVSHALSTRKKIEACSHVSKTLESGRASGSSKSPSAFSGSQAFNGPNFPRVQPTVEGVDSAQAIGDNSSLIKDPFLLAQPDGATNNKESLKRGRWIWECFPSNEKVKFVSRCRAFNRRASSKNKVCFEGRQNSCDSFASWAISDTGIKRMNSGHRKLDLAKEVDDILEFGNTLGIEVGSLGNKVADLLFQMEDRDGSGKGG